MGRGGVDSGGVIFMLCIFVPAMLFKRLKACIRKVDETRIAPFEDHLRDLLAADFDAAWASPAGIARNAAAHEIEDLWRQVDHLIDALHGRRPRDVTIN